MRKQVRRRLLMGIIVMAVFPAIVGCGNIASTIGIQSLNAGVGLPTSRTQVFFQHIPHPNAKLILHPDSFVMKAMPNITPPSETVVVYLPVYPGAKTTAPVNSIGDMGTSMDAYLVDGSLYFTSKDSAQQIQSWYTKQFRKLDYQVNGWGQSNDHGKTITTFVEYMKNGVPGEPTRVPNISLGFLSDRQNGQTVFKLKAAYIITPIRPKESYLPADIKKVVLINGNKSKTITNPAWISLVVGQINELQVTTPGITSTPAVVNGVNLTVNAKFYENVGSVMDVEFMLPTSIVRVGNVTLNDSNSLEKEMQAIFNE